MPLNEWALTRKLFNKKEIFIMASEKIMNFVEEIKKLSVLELSELVDAIQEEFGVTAAVAATPAAGAAGAAAERRRQSST